VNLFVVVWQGSTDVQRSALSALAGMTSVFAQLDPDSLAFIGTGESAFVAMIQSPINAAGPRVYRHLCEGGVTFYSGLPVDSTGDIVAHDAEELHNKWAGSSAQLEGQFCVFRLLRFPASLEICTDPLGMEQLYYAQSVYSLRACPPAFLRLVGRRDCCLAAVRQGHIGRASLGLAVVVGADRQIGSTQGWKRNGSCQRARVLSQRSTVPAVAPA
jgi:hypothetical protein